MTDEKAEAEVLAAMKGLGRAVSVPELSGALNESIADSALYNVLEALFFKGQVRRSEQTVTMQGNRLRRVTWDLADDAGGARVEHLRAEVERLAVRVRPQVGEPYFYVCDYCAEQATTRDGVKHLHDCLLAGSVSNVARPTPDLPRSSATQAMDTPWYRVNRFAATVRVLGLPNRHNIVYAVNDVRLTLEDLEALVRDTAHVYVKADDAPVVQGRDDAIPDDLKDRYGHLSRKELALLCASLQRDVDKALLADEQPKRQIPDDAERLRSALQSLEQAYSNRHSPQHRAACLTEARTVLASLDSAPKGRCPNCPDPALCDRKGRCDHDGGLSI